MILRQVLESSSSFFSISKQISGLVGINIGDNQTESKNVFHVCVFRFHGQF